MRQKIFIWILIFAFLVFGMETFSEFMQNHTYYLDMFKSWSNRKIMIWAFISATIPVLYLLYKKTFSLKRFFISILAALLVFTFIHTAVKWDILWWWFICACASQLITKHCISGWHANAEPLMDSQRTAPFIL